MNEYFKKKERETMATEILPYEITFRLVSCLLYTQEDTQGYEQNSVSGSLMLSELSTVQLITVMITP